MTRRRRGTRGSIRWPMIDEWLLDPSATSGEIPSAVKKEFSRVAQLVEQVTVNHRVGGSSPSSGAGRASRYHFPPKLKPTRRSGGLFPRVWKRTCGDDGPLS